jgi:hypothetical protein
VPAEPCFNDLKAKEVLAKLGLRRKALLLLRRMDVPGSYDDAPILRELEDESNWRWSPYTPDVGQTHLLRHGTIVLDGDAVLTIWLRIASEGSIIDADISAVRDPGWNVAGR